MQPKPARFTQMQKLLEETNDMNGLLYTACKFISQQSIR